MRNNLILIVTIICVGLPTAGLASQFNGLDDRCQSAPTAPEAWKISQIFRFVDRGKSYQLIHSAAIDGSGSLCLVWGKSVRAVGYNQAWYLDRVDRVSDRVFNVEIHDGNGNNTPTIKYRLDLTQPQNPQVKVLKKWITK